jgi:hypothetical protein
LTFRASPAKLLTEFVFTMHYIVTNGNAYAIDHPQDAIYGAPVLEDGNVDWDGAYDIAWDNLDEEEREYIAHVAYHLQEIAKLSEEHLEVFIK